MNQERSSVVATASGAAGLWKLGQPVPESNFAAEAKSCLERAAKRSPDDAKVREALAAYRTVAGKYGVRQTEGE